MNVFEWFRRLWYALHKATVVSGVYEDVQLRKGTTDQLLYTFRIADNSGEFVVTTDDPKDTMKSAEKGETKELIWIYGKKKAMISPFRTDDKSRKTLLICDVVSVIALIVFIGLFILIGSRISKIDPKNILLYEGCFLGSIAAMIIAGIIRKKLRKS